MTDDNTGSYKRFPEKETTKADLGSAGRMIETARAAARKSGKELRDEPAVTASQNAFAGPEDDR